MWQEKTGTSVFLPSSFCEGSGLGQSEEPRVLVPGVPWAALVGLVRAPPRPPAPVTLQLGLTRPS